jgi:hypothetical protein
MALTTQERLKIIAPYLIKKNLTEESIIHGERAIEARVPDSLRKQTTDFDIYAMKARLQAIKLRMALNREIEQRLFYVTQSKKHPTTWKVRAKGETYADFTEANNIPSEKIGGLKYVKLNYLKQHTITNLKNRLAEFRKEKDISILKRIKEFERLKQSRWL